jgi:paraquat-inducible protein B
MQDYQAQFDQWILSGLTARIEPANFLTGTLKLALEANGDPISELPLSGADKIIPWEPSELASFTEKLESILSKLDDLPLDVTVNRINKVLVSTDQTLLSLDSTLKSVETTAASLSPQAELFISVQDAVDELKSTLQATKPLIQQLTNKPSSLIFSGTTPADIEPKAKKQ